MSLLFQNTISYVISHVGLYFPILPESVIVESEKSFEYVFFKLTKIHVRMRICLYCIFIHTVRFINGLNLKSFALDVVHVRNLKENVTN